MREMREEQEEADRIIIVSPEESKLLDRMLEKEFRDIKETIRFYESLIIDSLSPKCCYPSAYTQKEVNELLTSTRHNEQIIKAFMKKLNTKPKEE